MRVIKILKIFFFLKTFTTNADYINIIDESIKDYFDNTWASALSSVDIILVKMEKVKMPDGAELEDYISTFKCEKEFNYNKIDYRVIITVSKGHNLDYKILIKEGGDFREVNENEKKIFYRYKVVYPDGEKYHEDLKSLFYSQNWMLLKLKPRNNNDKFYAFINNMEHIEVRGSDWMPLGHSSNFSDVYIIYSNIDYLQYIASSRASVGHKSIDLKGLNFENEDNVNISGWFCNCKNMITFKNIPKFKKRINISQMLEGCKSLENVDLGENKIVNADKCFSGCENLENVNLENINLEENANLNGMFLNCKSIKNIQGIETLVKEDDKAEVERMFEGAIVDGDLDFSQWGDKILCESMFNNSKVKTLKLFNLKEVLEYYREHCNEVIKDKEKEINDYKKEIEEFRKKLNELEKKEPKTEEDNENIKNTKEQIETNKKKIKLKEEAIKDYKKDIDDPHLDILENAEVDELYISEEFMPKKKDLDGVVGDNCTVKILYVVDKDGNQKRYEGFDDYKNNIKEQESHDDDNKTNEDQQIQQNIENVELPKSNHCFSFCAQCCIKCCCCCHNNNNLLGKKRNRE